MIKIKTWVNKKPEEINGNPNHVLYDGEDKIIPVTKIKCENFYKRGYFALVHDPKNNAPYNDVNEDGECWIHFCKSHNKNHKIQVIKDNQIIEV